MHTPGHARGHLCFYEERTGTLISGDNIVGLGSVLIDPPEGNMRDYLAVARAHARAAESLRDLRRPRAGDRKSLRARLDEYISHRLDREQKILEAVREGAATPKEIVARVYTDVSPKAHAMAERAVLAHLEKLEDGLVEVRRRHTGSMVRSWTHCVRTGHPVVETLLQTRSRMVNLASCANAIHEARGQIEITLHSDSLILALDVLPR